MRYKVSGAIAASWEAKAGVKSPFAGWERLFSLRIILIAGRCAPSLAALYASGFPRRAPVFQKAGGYWQDWHII